MKTINEYLNGNTYPGRGVLIGKSADNAHYVAAYFIMGRSENSRNRVFVEDGEGIRTQAFDPSKMVDPHLIIYVRLHIPEKISVPADIMNSATETDAGQNTAL